jgi:hypothetical protein
MSQLTHGKSHDKNRDRRMPHTNTPTNATSHAPDASATSGEPNEGEGNRTAARRYDEATRRYIAEGHGPSAAEEAERALDGKEGEELREAERIGRAGTPKVKTSRK